MPRARTACSVNTPVPCGLPATQGGRCDAHARQAAQAAEQDRGTRHARGYGSVHTRATGILKIRWGHDLRRGKPWICPRCLLPLLPGQAVDGDHFGTRPPAAPDRLSHAACNRGKRLP